MNEYEAAPYGHVFQSGGRNFFYDVNTNTLLEIEPVLAATLPLVGTLPEAEIISRRASGFSASQVKKALEAVATGQREGLFLALRPQIPAPLRPLKDGDSYDRDLRHLVLTITEACNLRCSYCLHGANLDWVRPHGHRSMSMTTACRAVDFFLDRCDPKHKPIISFYGGEPLLEIDLIVGVVEHIRSHPKGQEAAIAIDTNGVLLGHKATSLICRENIHLQVSLDGPPEIHDRQRRGSDNKPTHADIISGLKSLLMADPTLAKRLVFVVTLAPPFNLPAIDDYFADFPLFKDLGITQSPHLRVNFANLAGQEWPDLEEHFTQATAQRNELRRQYLDNLLADRNELVHPVPRAMFEADLVRFHLRSRRLLGDFISPGSPCSLGRRKLHVGIDGKLHPCERTGETFTLGTLETGILTDRTQQHQEGFIKGCAVRCAECWAVRLCNLCHAHLASCGVKSLAALPERECLQERNRIEGVMDLMTQLLSLPQKCRKFLDEYALE